MKSATLRLYQTLHTWVGLMAGWALFIAFFAGALTVFHEELHAWQNPLRADRAVIATKPADIDHFVNTLVRTHPAAAASAYVIFPNEGEPDFAAYWQNAKGDWQMITGSGLAAGKTSPKDLSIEPSKGELANFLNRLHYSLGLEQPGMYFMGVISVLYCIALISGVLLHLPRLKKDLLAVRPGRNLKRFWMDMHNVLGLFSLPFHLIFAITAPVLCLSIVLMGVFPPILWPMLRRPNMTLTASALLYVMARRFGWNLSAYPTGLWYFNPFAWQFLFTFGAWFALGGSAQAMPFIRSRTALVLGITYLLFALVMTMAARFDELRALIPPEVYGAFNPNDKTNLAPYRLLHFVVFAFFVVRLLPRDWPGLEWAIFRPAIKCGQQSLEVFCSGIFLSFAAHVALVEVSGAAG